MRVIDLTHVISENMPVYPGTEGPKFESANSYEVDGFRETILTMYTHTGTHMDAPAHIFKEKKTLDEFPVEKFVGKALVVDCSDVGEGQKITMDHLNKSREKIDKAEFIIFYTGWDKHWKSEKYFGNYPYIDDKVVEFLLSSSKKGIGLDTIGIDPIGDLTIHKRLFKEKEIVVIENLTNLNLLGEELFLFCALPLKHIDADGSPIRAIGILDEN